MTFMWTFTTQTCPFQATIVTNGSTTICNNTLVTLSANYEQGVSYQWQLNGANIPGATNNLYQTNIGGNYSLVVTDSCGTNTSNIITISVDSTTVSNINAMGATTFCSGNYVTLNASTGTGLTFQWRLNGNNIIGAIDSMYIASSQGNYSVTVSNSCGSSTSNTINVQHKKCVSQNINNSPLRSISKFDLELFPNPSHNEFYLFSDEEDQLYSLTVFDYAGRIVESYQNLISNINFNFGNNLSPGFYFVIINQENQNDIFRIIKL